jgi:N-methylhydantoinase A
LLNNVAPTLDRVAAAQTGKAVIGVDIGGTFTDVVLLRQDGKPMVKRKIPSTGPRFADAVLRGLDSVLAESQVDARDIAMVMHGTTVATNAILEGRGARTALVTTKGFRDVLEIGRLRHPSMFDYFWRKPKALVPRCLRFEIDERTDAAGRVDLSPTKERAMALAERLKELRVESAAVCFINSYRNAASERFVADLLRKLCRGVYISASHEILPEIREYERTSTTVVNAFVQPVVHSYLTEIVAQFRQRSIHCPILIMQSNGGLMNSDAARVKPVHLIESGPAAGVTATRHLAQRLNEANVIAFDMGGTTAKASVVENGLTFEADEYEVGAGMHQQSVLTKGGGYTIRVPSIDIAEVGAGGGSIAWIDDGGAPRVGPQSAQAVPGPACYGRGGTDPTVTDACVVLGYLGQTALAGGAQPIEPQRAFAAINDRVAVPLDLDVVRAAYGLYSIVIASMSKAVRAITSERGRDPRDFTLVAFGGAGPAHAAAMAAEFGIETVIIPIAPGLFSSLGLLVAELQEHAVMTYALRTEFDPALINKAFGTMERKITQSSTFAGHQSGTLVMERFVDVRYVGQSYELRIPVGGEVMDATSALDIRHRFETEHGRVYGHRGDTGQAIEIVNLRLRASQQRSATTPFAADRPLSGDHPVNASGASSRRAYFGPVHGHLDTPVLERGGLAKTTMKGPLIVEDMDATTVVPPDCSARLDDLGNIVITVPSREQPGSRK